MYLYIIQFDGVCNSIWDIGGTKIKNGGSRERDTLTMAIAHIA